MTLRSGRLLIADCLKQCENKDQLVFPLATLAGIAICSMLLWHRSQKILAKSH